MIPACRVGLLHASFFTQLPGVLLRHSIALLLCFPGITGLDINPDRPHNKLPYRGAWLWIGPEMIHLMELPNPDPLDERPEHGGRDRHFCVAVDSIDPLVNKLEAAGVAFTKSMSGRPALFFRDPGGHVVSPSHKHVKGGDRLCSHSLHWHGRPVATAISMSRAMQRSVAHRVVGPLSGAQAWSLHYGALWCTEG